MVEKSSEQEEFRRLQAIDDNNTFFVGIPKWMVARLGLRKNEYVRVRRDNGRIVIEKVSEGQK